MLNTFENIERQHLRRKERDRHLQIIDTICRDPTFPCLEETTLSPVADALNGVSLAKLPGCTVDASSSSKRHGRRLTITLFAIVVSFTAILAGLLTLSGPEGGTDTGRSPTGKNDDPNLSRFHYLFSMILDWNTTSRDKLEDGESAAAKALQWLAYTDLTYEDPETLRSRFALATLFYSTHDDGFKWGKSNHWLSSYPICLWHGVSCFDEENEIGIVKSLNLSSNGLLGSLPPELNLLGKSVKSLDVSSNALGGTIPEIGSLKNLQHLYLGPNNFISSIPSSIFQLSHLTHLYLNDCYLTGTIPQELGGLTKLQGLGLENNLINGLIPESIGDLTDLRILYLDGNYLSGSIPRSIPNSLIDLRLSRNKLHGTLPQELGNARFLQLMYIDSNDLEGVIDGDLFSKLPLLLEVQLYDNQFSGKIPSELGQLELLGLFYADGNLLTGSLPSSVGDLKYLESLYIFDNMLTGTIPSSIGLLENLVHFRVSKNNLSGFLPPELGSATSLETLYLNNNSRLHGTIPRSLSNLKNLKKVLLHGTNFSGSMAFSLCPKPSPDFVELVADCKFQMKCKCCDQCY